MFVQIIPGMEEIKEAKKDYEKALEEGVCWSGIISCCRTFLD